MKRRYLIPGVLALCALPAATWGQIVVLLNENFDELTPMLGATSVGAFSAIDGTNVDIFGGSLFGSLCTVRPASGNCIDMNGTGGNPQGILRSNKAFTLLPGYWYSVEFDLEGSQRGVTTSTTVSFGPWSDTYVLAPGQQADLSVNFPNYSLTTSYLTFTSNQGGNVGALLDDVVLAHNVLTPEPATVSLLALGVAGVGFARRRRRSQAELPKELLHTSHGR